MFFMTSMKSIDTFTSDHRVDDSSDCLLLCIRVDIVELGS